MCVYVCVYTYTYIERERIIGKCSKNLKISESVQKVYKKHSCKELLCIDA